MTSRRSVDENFALQALSMSQHMVPASGSDSPAQTITVGERLSVLSRRAAQLADAAVEAEREVEVAEQEFEQQRNIVNMHAEALAAAQRAANEAQLLLQVRKGEYDSALESAHKAHLEYGEFFKNQTQFMFASKASVSARRPSMSGSAAPSHSPAPSPSAAGPSSELVGNSNKRPRLSNGTPSSRGGAAIRGGGPRKTPTGVADPMAGEGLSNGNEADVTSSNSIRPTSSARGGRGGLKRADGRSSLSRPLPAANLENEALATAPPYFRSIASTSSSHPADLGSSRTRPQTSAAAPPAILARQILRTKASGVGNPTTPSTSITGPSLVSAAAASEGVEVSQPSFSNTPSITNRSPSDAQPSQKKSRPSKTSVIVFGNSSLRPRPPTGE